MQAFNFNENYFTVDLTGGFDTNEINVEFLELFQSSDEEKLVENKKFKPNQFAEELLSSNSDLSSVEFSSSEQSDMESLSEKEPKIEFVFPPSQSVFIDSTNLSSQEIQNILKLEPQFPPSQPIKYEQIQRNGSSKVSLKQVSLLPVSNSTSKIPMKGFDSSDLNDFKHVIYNMLVENYNDPSKQTFVLPVRFIEKGIVRTGFRFNISQNPEKKIPELYAMHIRKSQLDKEDPSSVFVQDLYKFYYRASMELLSKYFEKRDKFTFLDEDVPLFIPNGNVQEAEIRLKQIKSRARKKRSRVYTHK